MANDRSYRTTQERNFGEQFNGQGPHHKVEATDRQSGTSRTGVADTAEEAKERADQSLDRAVDHKK